MNTDALIVALAGDLKPVPRRALAWRIAVGLAASSAITLLFVVTILGVRPDLKIAMHGFSFWMKWAYVISLGLGAVVATARLARPDTGEMRWLWLLAIPVGLLAMVGAAELLRTPPGEWLAMWLGDSWKQCPPYVLLLSMPIFIGLLWSFRRLAPTRLRAAGAASGLAAGSCAAMLYCLHCPEVSAIFVLTWYTLGIGFAAGIGALLGPRLLRW